MSENTLSDGELTNKIVGFWHVPWEKEISFRATFKADGTLRLVGSTKGMGGKGFSMIYGNQFAGTWSVEDGFLYIQVESAPDSPMNIRIPFTRYRFPVADMLVKGSDFISAFGDVLKFRVVSITDEEMVVDHQRRGEDSWTRIKG